MKRWLKNTLISVACLIPLGFVVGFSTNWSNKTTITSVGSSGVKPFVEELSKEYLKDHKSIDITVDAGGSGFGIDQVADGFTNIGNASKNPFDSVNDEKNELKQKWTDRNIKTYTVAWEAICLVYIPPKNSSITDDMLFSPDNNSSMLSVSPDTIKKLYQAFSGFSDDDYQNSYPTLGDFASSYIDPSIKTALSNTRMIPYVRTGGSLTSGTAASFYEYSRFQSFDSKTLSDRTQNAFKVGNYGSNWKLVQTDEANSRAWDMFSKSNTPGSVVYLSSGFIAQNEDLIRKNHYGIFGYKKDSTTPTYSYTVDNMQNSLYNWCRPLNLMTSLDNDEGQIAFIQDYLLNDDKTKEIWKTMGAAVLSEQQKNSMKLNDNYAISDYELMKSRSGDNAKVFGAIYA